MAACAAAREVMTGEHAVGRVIARPFAGEPGAFQRTEGRKDFAVPPPGRSYLEELQDAGVVVHAVGKVRDLFAGVGIDHKHAGTNNAQGIAATTALLRDLDAGLVFVNLVETDQVYGHRHDVEGFHGALQEIDAAVGGVAGAAARRRPAGADRRPRRRPAGAAHRPHPRARAAAGRLRRPGRPPPRRPAGRRRRQRPAVARRAGRPTRSPALPVRLSARASRGRDDPPPARAPARGARARAPGDPRPALVPAAGPRRGARRGRGPAHRAPGPPRQVPDLGARRTTCSCSATCG